MEYTKEELTEGFQYLDELRESGRTNMFGAAQYMQDELCYGRTQAKDIHRLWMDSFDGSSVDERVEKVLNNGTD